MVLVLGVKGNLWQELERERQHNLNPKITKDYDNNMSAATSVRGAVYEQNSRLGFQHQNKSVMIVGRFQTCHRALKASSVDCRAMLKKTNDPILQQQRELQGQAAKVIQRAEVGRE